MISRTSIIGRFPVVSLGSVVEFLDHMRRPIKESDRAPGPFPYFGANGQQGTIANFLFDEPLVLLAEDGGFFDQPDRGIAYRIIGKTWVNNHAHVLRPKDKVDLNFLSRVLEHYDVSPFVTGTTRGKLTKAGAVEIPIPLPPLSEQRRIADVLDRAEALRAQRRAALEQVDALTQAVFLEMFGDPRSNPRHFPVAVLGSVVEEFRYGTSEKSQPSGFPVLRIPNVVNGSVDVSDVKYVPLADAEFRRLRLWDGDLLFVRTNGNPEFVGRCAIFDGHRAAGVGRPADQFVFASYLIRARLRRDQVDPVYLREFMLGAEGRRQLLAGSRTSAGQFNINTENLAAIVVPTPPLAFQQDFARRVAAIEKLKAAHRASLAEMDALFASLQHRAFRGEL